MSQTLASPLSHCPIYLSRSFVPHLEVCLTSCFLPDEQERLVTLFLSGPDPLHSSKNSGVFRSTDPSCPGISAASLPTPTPVLPEGMTFPQESRSSHPPLL